MQPVQPAPPPLQHPPPCSTPSRCPGGPACSLCSPCTCTAGLQALELVRLHARRLDPLHALRLLPAAAPLPLLLPSLETLCAAALQSLAARPTRKA